MPKGSFRVRSNTVHVHLLEPVPTTGYDYEHRHELMVVVHERMADVLSQQYGVESAHQSVEAAPANGGEA
jgi:1-acyl-sn-glycerol-3-phosphate acyltransferase